MRLSYVFFKRRIFIIFFAALFISLTLFVSGFMAGIRAGDIFKRIGYDVAKLFKSMDIHNGKLALDGRSEIRFTDPHDVIQIQEADIRFQIDQPDFIIIGFGSPSDETSSFLISNSKIFPGEFIRFKNMRKIETSPWPEGDLRDSDTHRLRARITEGGIAVKIDNGPEHLFLNSGANLAFTELMFRCGPNGAGAYIKGFKLRGFRNSRPFSLNLVFDRQAADWIQGLFWSALFCGALLILFLLKKNMLETFKARVPKAIWYVGASLILGPLHIVIHATLLVFSVFLILLPLRKPIQLENNYRKLWPWKDKKAMAAFGAAAMLFLTAFVIKTLAENLLNRLAKSEDPVFEDSGSENVAYHPYCITAKSGPPYELTFKARIQDQGLLRVDINRSSAEEVMYEKANLGGFESFYFAPGHKVGSTVYSNTFIIAPTSARSRSAVPDKNQEFEVRIRSFPPLLMSEINRSGGLAGRGSKQATPNICFVGFRSQVTVHDIHVRSLQKGLVGFLAALSDVLITIGAMLFILVVARFGWRLAAGTLNPEASLFRLEVVLPAAPMMVIAIINDLFFRNDFELFSTFSIRYGGLISFLFGFAVIWYRAARYKPSTRWWQKGIGLFSFAAIMAWLAPLWLPGFLAMTSYNAVISDLPVRDMYLVDPQITRNNWMLYQFRFAGRKMDVDEKSSRRVFLFGGSQAYGIGIDDPDKSITAVLERVLNERYGYLGKFETGNAAVPAGNLRSAYLNLERVVRYFNPEIVIFSTIVNDRMWDLGSDEKYQKTALARKADPEIPQVIDPLVRHVRLLMFTRPWNILVEDYMFKKYARDFTLICNLCRQLNLRYAFVYEPYPISPKLPQCSKGEFCHEGIDISSLASKEHKYILLKDKNGEAPMIDVQVPVLKHREELLYVDHIHFTERGQALFAETIADEIARRWPNPPKAMTTQEENH